MIELSPTDIAHGGEAVARVDGKAHFVAGAMPGEVVEGEITREKKSWARVELTRVIEPSPDRVEPRCRHFGDCGGCQWQFASYAAQLEWKRSIVAGQLRHLGGLDDPPVRETTATGDPYGYRNRMDFAVTFGSIGLRRRRSRETVAIEECHIMHPALDEMLEGLDGLGDARGLTVRTGIATGDRLVVVKGDLPDGAAGWGVPVAHRTEDGLVPVAGDGVLHEEIDGYRFRITGDAFFQNNTPGAERLVGLVREALDPQEDETLLDGYAGGGLFGVSVGRGAARVIAIESDLTAVVDFAHNAERAGIEHRLFNTGFVEGMSLVRDPWDIAVVDPPRDGLGARGIEAVTAAEGRAIAYVSCDPASLARDARLLAERGYRLDWAAPVDMFPQTFHVETVARFVRG